MTGNMGAWVLPVRAGIAAVLLSATVARGQEEAIENKWNVSLGLGAIQFEGDEELDSGFLGTFRVGYDHTEWWTWEAAFSIAPRLKETFRNDNGQRFSRLIEATDPPVHDTWGIGGSFDGLYHFTRWERLDPYLTIGVGAVLYGDTIAGQSFDPSVRGGCGVMYHFNDEWAVRADARMFVAGQDTEANALIDCGVSWTWGARVKERIVATGGPLDSDGDRLFDAREEELGTNPLDADTDKDGLSDGEEVLDYGTDPLNKDTDYDALMDGEEVKKHKTDPLVRDTDNGGVSDGHEVLEDGTDPLNGDDDLQLFELYIPFEYDKADIEPRYYGELDIIGKVMTRDKGATAVVEGHADRKKTSDEAYNLELSERRAQAVVDYLVAKRSIAAERLKAKGFGFSRPKAANDPEVGNPVNRRVEVYIRRTDGGAANAMPESDEGAAASENK